jgi:methylenetetrahydrofolate dehydrogenase (NADP+)/methenyltetrahydrofolate cyclohydrolase
MTQVVDGKGLSQTLRAEVRERVLKLEGGPPGLAAIVVGEDPASRVYVRNKRRACERAGSPSWTSRRTSSRSGWPGWRSCSHPSTSRPP